MDAYFVKFVALNIHERQLVHDLRRTRDRLGFWRPFD
jgi:hypothetical protein